MRRTFAILPFVLLVLGCSGTMDGMVRDSGTRITLSYVQGIEHDDLQVQMPDGELFSGKAVMSDRSSALISSIGSNASGSGTAFSVVQTYTGSMVGVLFGDRGNTMQCRFQYADSGGFTPSGGVGLCETSDGQLIDVQW